MHNRTNTDEPEAFTVERFMAKYGVGRTTTYALIKKHKLDARKLGCRTFITAASARALFESLPKVKDYA